MKWIYSRQFWKSLVFCHRVSNIQLAGVKLVKKSFSFVKLSLVLTSFDLFSQVLFSCERKHLNHPFSLYFRRNPIGKITLPHSLRLLYKPSNFWATIYALGFTFSIIENSVSGHFKFRIFKKNKSWTKLISKTKIFIILIKFASM